MKILYLTHRLPFAPNRGDRLRAYHMLRHLSRHHAVDLVSLVHNDEEADHVKDLATITASVTTARVRRMHSLANAATAMLARRTLTHALLDAPNLKTSVEMAVRSRQPDLVLAYCSGMARLALEPAVRTVPFILDMVDVDSEKWASLGETARGPKRWIYRREAALLRRFERIAVEAAATTLVVNDREQRLLQAIGAPGRIEVVPNGIELSKLHTDAPPMSEPRVVFCGVMNYEPNETAALWLARDVWPLVRRARPDATLTFVGAHPTRRLRDLARTDSSIEVTGSVADVRPFLWRAAVSAAPLLVARGVQNKVLEATAAGLPSVVTSAVMDGLPNDVVSACTLADTAPAFSAAIVQLLALGAAERRAIARRPNLELLTWSHALAPLDAMLQAAVTKNARVA